MSCKHTTDCATCTSIVAAITSELDGALAALDIYVANDDKCDQMLRSVGLDDTGNTVPRLHGLIKQHDEALALVVTRTNERDYYAKELDKATGMVEMYVDDAEAARLLWRQSEAACAQMHAQCDAAIRERDELGRRSAADFQGLEEIRSETSRQLNAALDERDAAIKERDEAQRLVAEMRAALIIGRDIVIETSSNNRHNKFVEDAYDVIEASAHVAGR